MPSGTPLNSSGLTPLSLSSNGQIVVFTSEADGLVSGDTNGCEDVYAHDFVTGSNILVSVAADGFSSGNSGSFSPAIDASGRYIVFTSDATNLVPGDSNDASDVFVRNLQTGATTLVSVDAVGLGGGNGNSYAPQFSADGRRVLFLSAAINLTAPPVSSGTNLFWRDLQSGVTYAVSTGGRAALAVMTPDGNNVFFAVSAGYQLGSQLSLWNAQSQTTSNIFVTGSPVVDLAITADASRGAFGTTTQIYVADFAAQTNWPLSLISRTLQTQFRFSGNGNSLAYLQKDSNGTNQVYLYDFQNASNLLLSQSYSSGSGGNAGCDSPAISANGRFVAYRSAATNLVPGDANGVPDVFLFDRLTGGTTLVSVSLFGGFSANGRSLAPVFSGDGQTLCFESWASDLALGDFNEASDVFAFSLAGSGSVGVTNSTPPLAFTGIGLESAASQFSTNQPLTLTWPSVPGAGYQVQFKNSLNDPEWQPLASPATVVGGQGNTVDRSPDASRRFYRIVSF
jgi:Tol biopolymer transport system component